MKLIFRVRLPFDKLKEPPEQAFIRNFAAFRRQPTKTFLPFDPFSRVAHSLPFAVEMHFFGF
jgi:hypothetical protein